MSRLIPLFVLISAVVAPVLDAKQSSSATVAPVRDAKQSVFKLFVKTRSAPAAYIEGSAFVVASDGPSDNPHLYFVTSAHNFFTPNQRTQDPVVVDDIIEAKVQYATDRCWPIDPKEIRFIGRWNSYAKDVAIFRIKSAGRSVEPLVLTFSWPDQPRGKRFTVLGYPARRDSDQSPACTDFDEASSLDLQGAAESKGTNCAGQDYLLQGQYDHGMSGGPVIFNGSVVGIVSDQGPSDSFRCFQTLNIVENFINENLPTLSKCSKSSSATPCRPENILDRITVSSERGSSSLAAFLDFLSGGPDGSVTVTLDPKAAGDLHPKNLIVHTEAIKDLPLRHVLDRIVLPQLPGPNRWTYELVGNTVIIERTPR